MSAATVNFKQVKKVRIASSIALVVSVVGWLLAADGFTGNGVLNIPASIVVVALSTLLFAFSAHGFIWVGVTLDSYISKHLK